MIVSRQQYRSKIALKKRYPVYSSMFLFDFQALLYSKQYCIQVVCIDTDVLWQQSHERTIDTDSVSKPEDVRWKWKVDGKEDWSEYQAAVTEHIQGWEDWVKEATASGTDHGEIVEVVWEEWKRRVTSVAERGIRLMKVVPGRAKSW